MQDTEDYPVSKTDLAVLHFYFGQHTTTGTSYTILANTQSQYYAGFHRSISMSMLDFISMIGGCFGLCLGFSLVSFMEIIYWLCFRVIRDIL